MGMALIYALIFLALFSSIAIGLFVYSRRRKSKVGLTTSIIMLVLVILALLTNTIDEFTITKKEVISDLKYINIQFTGDFEIVNNKVTGMPERIQETEIEITQNDKDRIISEIKTSSNFKSYANEHELTNDTSKEQFRSSNTIFNFRYPEFYSRETYSIFDRTPTRMIVSLYDNRNTLKYQKIED